MKLHQLICESTVTLTKSVSTLDDLKDPKTKKYYTGVVNVKGYVNLRDKKLSKLPVKFGTVGGYFACFNNQLTTLEGAPSSIGGNFECDGNKLTTLDGAPSEIGGSFFCTDNELTSLEGVHKIIKIISGEFYCRRNPITSGGIGLLLIEGLKFIHSDHPAFDIIEEYLGQGKKGLLLCQDELIEAGYEEFAKL